MCVFSSYTDSTKDCILRCVNKVLYHGSWRLALVLLLDECDFSEERIRQYWVHLINERRKELGDFHHLFNDLREDRERFKNYPRMDINTFDSILDMIRTDMEAPLPPPPLAAPLPTPHQTLSLS